MIKLQRIKSTDTRLYQYMVNLLTLSFPPEEYRRFEDLRQFTIEKSHFHNNIIFDNNIPIGLITYWDFDLFFYVEHFAIHPDFRNGGYGSKVLAYLCHQLNKPIVLEAEIPDNEMAQRRIAFYRRNGFELWNKEYFQPPYKPGDVYLPMNIMAYGKLSCEKDFDTIKKHIYRDVYGIRDFHDGNDGILL